MNKQRRLTKESINELAKIHTNIPNRREQKKIQKGKFEMVKSRIASLSDDLEKKRKAREELVAHIAEHPDATIEDSFNHLLSKKHPVHAIAHAIDRHYGSQTNDGDTYDEDREREKEKFKRDVDRHVFRESKTGIDFSDEPNEYGETGRAKRIREILTTVQKNRALQKHMNTPEGAAATKHYVDTGERINPSEYLKKQKSMEAQIVCPVKLRERIAALQTKPKVEEILNQNFTKDDKPSEGSLMDESGKMLHHKTASTHYEMTRIHAKDLGLDLSKPYGGSYADDEDIHKFLQKTNTIRVQNFPHIQKISLHIPHRLSSSQISRIRDFEKEDPNLELGYAVGKNYKNMSFGLGVQNLLRDHAKQFGQRGASQEGEENMTYQNSKRIKLLKELFSDKRVKKD